MSTGSKKKCRGAKDPPSVEMAVGSRIDAPHPVAGNVEPEPIIATEAEEPSNASPVQETPVETAAPSPVDAEVLSQQMHAQASQLAEHLRSRQKELDHRESELNSWAAQMDRDARAARLWLTERMAELEEREKALAGDDAQQPFHQQAEALATREQRLVEAEMRLEEQRVEIQKLHQHLIEDRRFLDEDSRTEQERRVAEHRRALAELDEKRKAIEQRNEQVDQSRTVLEQMRAELERMHRETLEIRLATEELWADLAGASPPAALTRSLARIRTKLADHYRMANSELQQQKVEIERLRGQLNEQYEKLLSQKRQFDQWAAGCREEVERQSARLLVRGQEIDQREIELREQLRGWQADRLELQQEIRRLKAKLHARTEAAMPL